MTADARLRHEIREERAYHHGLLTRIDVETFAAVGFPHSGFVVVEEDTDD